MSNKIAIDMGCNTPYLSIERAAKVHIEQFIVSDSPKYCILQGMTPNGHCFCNSS